MFGTACNCHGKNQCLKGKKTEKSAIFIEGNEKELYFKKLMRLEAMPRAKIAQISGGSR